MQKKLKEIKLGEVFTYGGHEWIKLEQEGFCLMKGLLTLVEVLDEDKTSEETGKEDITDLIKKWAKENNLTQRTYDQHIYRLIRKIGDLTKHIEENDYNDAKHDLGYIYAALVILAKKLSGTGDEDYTSFLIDEIEAGRNIW